MLSREKHIYLYVMNQKNEINQRIKRLRGPLSQKEFALKLGVSLAALQNYEGGKRVPPTNVVIKLSDMFSVPTEWILTGKTPSGYMLSPTEMKELEALQTKTNLTDTDRARMKELWLEDARMKVRREAWLEKIELSPSEIEKKAKDLLVYMYTGLLKEEGEGIKVPIYSLAGAGQGKELTEHKPMDTIILSREFMRPEIVAVKVRGNSMEPTIWEGAICGVNTKTLKLTSGDIYAFWLPYEGAVIKRIFVGYEKLILKSDNKEFPPIELHRQELEIEGLYRLLGKVEWIVQRRELKEEE